MPKNLQPNRGMSHSYQHLYSKVECGKCYKKQCVSSGLLKRRHKDNIRCVRCLGKTSRRIKRERESRRKQGKSSYREASQTPVKGEGHGRITGQEASQMQYSLKKVPATPTGSPPVTPAHWTHPKSCRNGPQVVLSHWLGLTREKEALTVIGAGSRKAAVVDHQSTIFFPTGDPSGIFP